MNKLNNIFKTVIIVFALTISFADVSAQKNSKAVINLMQDKYNTLNSFTSDFIQIREYEILSEIDTLHGKISLLKPDYFIFETQDSRMLTDGKSIWDYNLFEKKVTIDDYVDDEDSFLPKDFLFNFPKKFVTEDFRPEKREGKDGFVMEMVPKNPDEEIMQDLEVWIEKDIWLVKQVKYTDIDDNVFFYILKNYKIDSGFNVDSFKAKLPGKGIIPNDLRKKKDGNR